ncbi:MAG: hypothetical protein H6522_05460 [Mycolicibacterium sp.]|nr:hypothetical protein [Mycolicibacterium sp.]
MAADPGRHLSGIDVLDGVEHARLDGWGNRAALSEPAPVRLSIPEVFAEQVSATPEATAITFAGQSLTYAELDEASDTHRGTTCPRRPSTIAASARHQCGS